MAFLFAAVLAFSLLHLIPAIPSLKAKLQDRLGALYGPFFGVTATITLALIVWAWSLAPFEPVYDPIDWSRHINMALSLVGFCFLGIFFFRGKLRLFLRHPFAIAIVFWATGHLIANGDKASIIMFGTLLIYAILFIILARWNKVFPTLVMRDGHDILSIVAGLAVYVAMVQMHKILIGVPVISITQIFSP